MTVVRKCLFPVAGYGTRFLPATKSMPKEMLPIVDKPLVHFGVEEALQAGIREMSFVTGRGKQAIMDYFDLSYELEAEIRGTPKEQRLSTVRDLLSEGRFVFTRQRKIQGLGHAVLTAKVLIGDEPFGVVLADDLCLAKTREQNALVQLLDVFSRYGCSVLAVEEIEDPEILSRFGVIDGRQLEDGLFEVQGLVEKPPAGEAPSRLGIVGRYLLTPDIFPILEALPPGRNGEIQLTDALVQQLQTDRVLAVQLRGKRFDCGDIAGYVEATNFYYQNFYLDEKGA